MRYIEIVEADTADDARRDAERRRRDQQKLADARRKKSDAARDYQEDLRSAGAAEQAAQSALRRA